MDKRELISKSDISDYLNSLKVLKALYADKLSRSKAITNLPLRSCGKLKKNQQNGDKHTWLDLLKGKMLEFGKQRSVSVRAIGGKISK